MAGRYFSLPPKKDIQLNSSQSCAEKNNFYLSLTPGVKISPLLRDHYHHAITGRVGTVPIYCIYFTSGCRLLALFGSKTGMCVTSGCSIFFRVTFSFAFFVCFHLRTFALSLLDVLVLHFLRSGFVSLIMFSESR